jgi:hypothetical protein
MTGVFLTLNLFDAFPLPLPLHPKATSSVIGTLNFAGGAASGHKKHFVIVEK